MSDETQDTGADNSFVELLAGFSLGSRRARRSEPAPEPPPTETAKAPRHAEEPPPEQILEDLADARLVRPYSWTGGRTRSSYELRVETLISTTRRGQEDNALSALEHRTIATLCREPRSVAEVAVQMSVPLGVARVILSDMAELGLVAIHRNETTGDGHFVLMERVLSGLRRL